MRRDRIYAIAVLIPSIVVLAIFVYGFIFWTGWTSLTNNNALQALSGRPATFIGMQNYIDLFTGVLNNRFRIDMVNTVFFTLLFIAVCLGVGLLLAILLDQKVTGEGVFRTIFLFPMALSFVVTGVVWKWLFNPGSGINILPTFVGLPAGNFRWFISEEIWLPFNWQDVPSLITIIGLGIVVVIGLLVWSRRRTPTPAIIAGLALLGIITVNLTSLPNQLLRFPRENHGFNVALFAVVIAAGWQMAGYTMAMYLAGLRGISEDLREAARVDGATEVGIYQHVILPLLQPITLSAVIILGHISLKIFDLVYTMGGDTNLFIDMPGLNMYLLTFRSQEFARGAAVAMVMLIMVALVIVPYLTTSLRSEKS